MAYSWPYVLRRTAGIALAATLVTGINVATPASASTLATITPVSWAYVDSAAPHTSFGKPVDALPVGAHVDAAGVTHVSKSYVTVDISALRGSDILSASLLTAETAVNDCATTRETEVWLTDPHSPEHKRWKIDCSVSGGGVQFAMYTPKVYGLAQVTFK